MDEERVEIEKLRDELTDIYNSRAWHFICAMRAVKDFVRNPFRFFKNRMKRIPLVVRAASVFGVRSRSRPIIPKASRVREIERLFRRDERQLIMLSKIPARPLAGMRVAVHLHLFYLDMAPYFKEQLSRLPVRFDLFISVTEDGGGISAYFEELTHVADVTVEVVENRGRDVMPMIKHFGQRLAGYDVFLHIHSKKSPHSGTLSGWLAYLMRNLLPEQPQKILSLFAGHPELGILYPEPTDAFPYWTLTNGINFEQMSRLFDMLSLDFPVNEKYPDFPVGTMFWARGAALAPLLAAPVEGFPDERGQTDGTLAHAVERSLGMIAAHTGYRPAQINAVKNRVFIGPGLKNLQEYIAIDAKSAFLYLKGFKNVVFGLSGTLVMPDGQPRAAVVSLLNRLRKNNIVVAGDTELSSADVREILIKCGVERDVELVLSSETGCSKKDGSLYDLLKKRFKGHGFVNVGDDELIDAHIPNMRRIHHLHVMHPRDMAAVIGLTEPSPQQVTRLVEDPFCLLELLHRLARDGN
jgi:hypothetical protein